jgi:hypothetical protein
VLTLMRSMPAPAPRPPAAADIARVATDAARSLSVAAAEFRPSAPAAPAPSAAAAAYFKAIQGWELEGRPGVPLSGAQLRALRDSGGLGEATQVSPLFAWCSLADAADALEASKAAEERPAAAAPPAGAAEAAAGLAAGWQYRDPNGTVQGPFPAARMLAWRAAGHFQADLPVRALGRRVALGAALAMAP